MGDQNSIIWELMGWWILPKLVNSVMLGVYRGFKSRFSRLAPRGSQGYENDRRVSFLLIITGYLLFTMINSYQNIQDDPEHGPNYYNQFNLPIDCSKNDLKREYRKLSVSHHPDKVGPGGESRWIEIQTMYEVLTNPVLKFGYERFGPEVLKWTKFIKQPSDVVYLGVRYTMAMYYLSSIIGLYLLSIVSQVHGQYWRYFLMIVSGVVELAIVTKGVRLVAVDNILYHSTLLPFQQVQLLRKFIFALQLGFAQLGGMFASPKPPNLNTQIDKLYELARSVEEETSRRISMLSAPVKNNEIHMKKVKEATSDVIIERQALNRLNS